MIVIDYEAEIKINAHYIAVNIIVLYDLVLF